MKSISYLGLFLQLVCFSGCIEVRDKYEAAPMVEEQSIRRLIVDEPLYLLNGQFVSQREVAGMKSAAPADFEFRFDEVHFEEGGTLYTLGNNVRIHAQTLTSNKGKIATFPQEQTAIAGENGRAGGHLFVSATKAIGILEIEMRGESGGEGLPGNPPDELLRGEKGAPGRRAACGYGTFVLPTDGLPGLQGLSGYPGHPGGRGGDSGTLELMFKDSTHFTNLIQKFPGKGGKGGRGGAGGAGGPGGDPGFNRKGAFPCRDANRGPEGPQGDTGPEGAPGENGLEQTVCITKNEAMGCY